MDLVLDNDYIDFVGESVDLTQVMRLENQQKMVIKEKMGSDKPGKIGDPRKKPQEDQKTDSIIFEQPCVVPEMHPMHNLPALNNNEEFDI